MNYYSVSNFPHFICAHGNWSIFANAKGKCAAIPTGRAARNGCKPSHFGTVEYVKATLGIDAASILARKVTP